jgi:hypothetical protein
MDAIAQVQVRHAAHAFEQKGQEDGPRGLGDGGKHLAKLPRVVRAELGRHLHAGDDDFRLRVARTDALDDALEVATGDGGAEAAQAVVGPEREHEDVGRRAQRPVDAAQPARGGLTAEAGIDDAPGQPGGGNLLLHPRRV